MTAIQLTALLGRPVRSDRGDPLGRVADLGVRLDGPVPHVTHVVVAAHGNRRTLSYDAVVELGPAAVIVDTRRRGDGQDDVLLLERDVLDTQVIDVRGRRVARVGDVELEPGPDGLRLVGVETGAAAVARRLGAGRLAGLLPAGRVGWDDLHLTSGRGHRLQLRSEASAVHTLDADGLALVVAHLPAHRGQEVLEQVAPVEAAEVRRRVRPRRRFGVMRARRHAPS